MAKLYFRYGTVGSAKTLNLLAVAHSYEQQNKKVVVLKPSIDTRFGENIVRSRAGLMRHPDALITKNQKLDVNAYAEADCILVDEVQFLTANVIDQLRFIATHHDVPVICYGLRTDFRLTLFEGSRRLIELADVISEVKTTCYSCKRKAVFNLKTKNGVPTTDGPTIELGAEEIYRPVCAYCYDNQIKSLRDDHV